jgi:DNA-binding SARP family transcriptional activator
MRFQVLGPLRVTGEDFQVTISGINQRAALGYLLLNANRTVATSELVHALWAGDAPPTARKMVQNAMAKLRRTLARSRAREKSFEISTRPPGYFLRVPPESIDSHLFLQLTDKGRDELTSGRFEQAAETLRAALALWRGPALSDLAENGIIWPQMTALDEARLNAFEDRVEADIALGYHRKLASELESTLTAEPARERLCGQLMQVLYRCGRQREALRLYRRLQLALAEKFGLDPSRELQELEQAILNHDPSLAWTAPLTTPRRDGDPADESRSEESGASQPSASQPSASQPSASQPSASQPSAGGAVQLAACPSAVGRSVVERKRISVLLIRAQLEPMIGVDDLESIDASLKELQRVIDAACPRLGGMVWATIGSSWCIVFGVPRAREDDPVRAVSAALAIKANFTRALRDLEVPWSADVAIKAAVATGDAMVTYHPDGDHRVAAVTGDVMDAGQELLAAVPIGHAKICDITRKAMGIDPVRSPVSHIDFVGREPEMKLLLELLAGVVQWKQPSLVRVLGEAGIGKSRLITEFGQAVADGDRDVCFLYGRSLPVDRRGSLHAAGQIVLSYAGVVEGDPDADDRVADALSRLLPEAADREALTGLWQPPDPAAPDTPQASAAQVSTEMFRAWCRFITGIASTPCILVFEDLHWADDALLTLVENTAGNVSAVPLLIVVTARPELLEARSAWNMIPARTTITLGPLYNEITESLLKSLVPGNGADAQGPGDVGSPACKDQDLIAQIAGNPLFAREYARELRHDLVRHPIVPPETVRGIIAARIDSLSLCEKVVLRNTSVFSDTAWTGGIAALIRTEPDSAEGILGTLEKKGFLRRAGNSSLPNNIEYNFCYALVRDIAYSQLSRTDRIDLHLRAASWLGTLPPHYSTLIPEHYKQAIANCRAVGRPADQLIALASQALADAGRNAACAGADATAFSCYQEALDLCPPDHPLHRQLELLIRNLKYTLGSPALES